MYVLLYFIIPELLPLSYNCAPFCDGVPWMPRFVALVGLLALISGYYLSYGLPIFKVSPKVKINEKLEYRFVLFAFLISCGALYTYAYSYGGFINALSYAAMNRLTGKDIIDAQGGGLAQYFVGIAYVVFAICQYKLYQNSRYKKKYIAVLMGTVIVIISYGLIKGGRGAIFQVILMSLFIHFNLRGLHLNVKKITALVLALIIGLWFVAYGKKAIIATTGIFRGDEISYAFDSIGYRETEYLYGRLISEFAHPIKSLGVAMDSDIHFNLMEHFWVAPLHLIPTRLLGSGLDKPTRISDYNTELLTGSQEGGIPPGLVGSFWYGGGLIGVLAGCMVFGVGIGWMQRQCYGVVKVYQSAFPIVLYIFFKMPWFLNNGDLSVFLKHQFHFFIFLLLLLAFSVFRRKGMSRLTAS